MTSDFFTRSSEQFGGKISFIVTDIVSRLRSLGAVKIEGIFRLNSSLSEEQKICSQLNEGRINLDTIENGLTLANVLKRYYRGNVRYHPLIPFNIFDQFLKVAGNDCVSEFKSMFKSISRSNYLELAFLMTFLHEVASFKEENKMDSANLSRMFGPNILLGKNENPDKINTAGHDARNLPVQLLIENADKVFDNFTLKDEYVLTDKEIDKIKAKQYIDQDVRNSAKLRELRMLSYVKYIPREHLYDSSFTKPK